MDVAGDDGGSSSAEPPQPQPAVPVHVTISITEGGAGAIDFGIDHVSPALLTSRPRLKPGRQVVQLTITGCPLQIDGKVREIEGSDGVFTPARRCGLPGARRLQLLGGRIFYLSAQFPGASNRRTIDRLGR